MTYTQTPYVDTRSGSHPAHQWLKQFLSRRGISEPDGRPLYSYQPSYAEFIELQALLKDHGFGPLPGPLFVLYCALWFAFSYESQRVTWATPVSSLNWEDRLSQPERSEWVSQGASFWKHRSLLTFEGHYYIGYVFSQAGVPVKSIQNQAGWLYNCIDHAFRWQLRNGQPHETYIQQYLEQLFGDESSSMHWIPSGVDTNEALKLITKAVTVLRQGCRTLSKATPTLPGNTDTLSPLQKAFPSCQYDREIFGSFLRHFRDSLFLNGDAPTERTGIKVERTLIPIDGGFDFVSTVTLLTLQLSPSAFCQTFGLPSSLSIATQGLLLINQRKIATVFSNGETVTLHPFGRKEFKFHGSEALAALRVTYVAGPLRQTFEAERLLTHGQTLDLNEPLIFLPSPQVPSYWLYKASGSCHIAGTEALVLVNKAAHVRGTVEHSTSYTELGELFNARILKLQDAIEIELHDDHFHIGLREVTTTEVIYELEGNLWKNSVDGLPIYRGLPLLRARHPATGAIEQVKHVTWQNDLRQPITEPPSTLQIVTARVYGEHGELLRRFRFAVLPPNATHSFSLAHHSWTFTDWGLNRIEVADSDVHCVQSAPQTFTLTCEARHDINAPMEFTAAFFGQGELNPILLTLDYPEAFSGFLSRSTHRRYAHESTVTPDQLRDLQVVVRLPPNLSSRSCFLRLYPSDQVGSNVRRATKAFTSNIPIPIDPKTNSGFLNFDDFAATFYRTLRLSTSEKAQRYVAMEIDGFAHCRLIATQCSGAIYLLHSPDRLDFQANPRRLAFIKARPLWHKDPGLFLGQVDRQTELPIPETIRHSDEPWWLYEADDKKYRTLPVIFCPPHLTSQPNDPMVQQLPALWKGPFSGSGAIYRQMSGVVKDMLKQPRRYIRDWGFFIEQIQTLGARGFALLPYWEALRQDIPLAFALATVLTALTPCQPNERSVLYSVSRLQGWRWDLISPVNLQTALNRLSVFSRTMGFEMTNNPIFQALLHDETLNLSPMLRHHIQLELLKLKDYPVEASVLMELSQAIDGSLLRNAPVTPSLLKQGWQSLLDRYQNGLVLAADSSYCSNTSLMLESEAQLLQYIDELPEGESTEKKAWQWLNTQCLRHNMYGSDLERIRSERLPLRLTIMLTLCWKNTDQTENGLLRQHLLSQKAFFFLTESILSESPAMTADCDRFANLLMIYLQPSQRH